ncbi:uncharacterized protein C2845_PM07G16550 [Panicum miliaceum]|uniref:GDSL esterase/lipase n=1 Tax=Panicum miliaceum TaxID=4540 RepID=A0A3L6SQ55_PANMI|nr:uncharacterized protein C2845_PM07G16550 [Panicum miliaceum]
MSSFKCEPHSFSGAIILILVVLLLNPHVGLCSCYKRIFSFGDSIIDTGNFVHLGGKAASKYKERPYGMTFFKNATGRVCDGRVLFDFYAEALKLPLIPPILPKKDSGEFPHGANFATVGATARGLRYSGPPVNDTVGVPWSLGMQMDWLDQMMQRLGPGDGAQRQFLRESLVVMGEIGSYDYNSWFSAGQDVEDIIPDVITYISHFTEDLIIYHGAKAFLIPNIFPMGCLASYLSRYHSDNPKDYDEHGCLRWLNEVSQKHNQALSGEVTRLRFYHPGVKLIYADYYGAAMEFIKNPAK